MKELSIAYTPDSDDVFNYYAWEHGHVRLGVNGYKPVFNRNHIIELNHAAQKALYDVVAVSSVFYPMVSDKYWILCAGNSVVRNLGPTLVSKHYTTLKDLNGKLVAVGGHPTTGSVLATMYCPGIELIEMHYESIVDAIDRDEVDAGVMIHEEILHYQDKKLECVCDLGNAWCEDTGLPLPVGLNLVSKDLGIELARQVATACQHSLIWGYRNSSKVYSFANQFGRGHASDLFEMFIVEDFLCLPEDARIAMKIMFKRVAEMNLGPGIDSFNVIEGLTDPNQMLHNEIS